MPEACTGEMQRWHPHLHSGRDICRDLGEGGKQSQCRRTSVANNQHEAALQAALAQRGNCQRGPSSLTCGRAERGCCSSPAPGTQPTPQLPCQPGRTPGASAQPLKSASVSLGGGSVPFAQLSRNIPHSLQATSPPPLPWHAQLGLWATGWA